jgi:hypothetical protein
VFNEMLANRARRGQQVLLFSLVFVLLAIWPPKLWSQGESLPPAPLPNRT